MLLIVCVSFFQHFYCVSAPPGVFLPSTVYSTVLTSNKFSNLGSISVPEGTHLMLLASSTTSCLQMPLWLFLAAAALFGTFSSPQHLMQESHPETGRRCVCARRHDPPGRTRARPRAGAPRLSLRANAPPSRAGTGAAAAINARRRALVQKMKGATMADPERSTQSAPSAPIARTAAPGPPCHHNHHQSHLDLLCHHNHLQSHLDLLCHQHRHSHRNHHQPHLDLL